MSVVSMKELLEAGVHFGHQTKRWDPRMKPFIFTQRKGIHILDLQKTVEHLDKAYNYVKESVGKGAMVLFVGTKKQSQDAIMKEATRCEMPYVSNRWLGGMLTNFTTITKSRLKLEELEGILGNPDKDKLYTKKEILKMTKIKDKLAKQLGGIRTLTRLPDLVFVIDPNTEYTAVNEARKLKITVCAVVDTNCNPQVIDYPIPGNDDAIRAVNLFASVIANAVLNGKKELQMKNEGRQAEQPEDLKNANLAYSSRIDEGTAEDIAERSFSAEEFDPNKDPDVAADKEPVVATAGSAAPVKKDLAAQYEEQEQK